MSDEERFFRMQDGNMVRFRWTTIKNERLSAGRPVFDKSLIALISCPNNPHSEVTHEIERHMADGPVKIRPAAERFARELAAFRSGDDNPDLAGTPLSQWPALDIAQAASLRALNIHTVEAIAGLNDTGMQHIGMGARALQAKAKAFLEAAAGNAPAEKLAAENQELRDEIAALRAEIRAMPKVDGRTREGKALKEAAA